MGGYGGRPSTAVYRGIAMAVLPARGTLVPALVVVVQAVALAQTAAAPARPPAGPSGATAAWTLKLKGDVRWQQVTPAGALLVSTRAGLAGGGTPSRPTHPGENPHRGRPPPPPRP